MQQLLKWDKWFLLFLFDWMVESQVVHLQRDSEMTSIVPARKMFMDKKSVKRHRGQLLLTTLRVKLTQK